MQGAGGNTRGKCMVRRVGAHGVSTATSLLTSRRHAIHAAAAGLRSCTPHRSSSTCRRWELRKPIGHTCTCCPCLASSQQGACLPAAESNPHAASHQLSRRPWPPQDKALMQQNLQTLARQAQWLVLWLDCDREGENIGFEVRATAGSCGWGRGCLCTVSLKTPPLPPEPLTCARLATPCAASQVMRVCCGANQRLTVKRARFSALIPRRGRRLRAVPRPPCSDHSSCLVSALTCFLLPVIPAKHKAVAAKWAAYEPLSCLAVTVTGPLSLPPPTTLQGAAPRDGKPGSAKRAGRSGGRRATGECKQASAGAIAARMSCCSLVHDLGRSPQA